MDGLKELLEVALDYRGVTTDEQIELYGERPLLIVASEEDAYAADSSQTLADTAQGQVQLEMYNGAGHGTRMFAQLFPDDDSHWGLSKAAEIEPTMAAGRR